jgi:mycofactocin precursor
MIGCALRYAQAMEHDVAIENTADQEPIEIEEELLVEEISIDGMCGVY